MDRQVIEALIDVLAKSDLAELEFTQGGATLRLVKRSPGVSDIAPVATNAAPGEARAAVTPAAVPEASPTLFRSPLYGVVHLRPSPEAPPFVRVGDAVCAGQSLCMIEAMKAFSEVRAAADGVVAEVLVESGTEVEAGQILFRFA